MMLLEVVCYRLVRMWKIDVFFVLFVLVMKMFLFGLMFKFKFFISNWSSGA